MGTSALDLLSAAVEHAEGGIAELATARVADHPSPGGSHPSRRGDSDGDDGPSDGDGECGDGESFDSRIDVDEVVRVVTRMAEEGPTITVVPVDRKHHDVNELVRLRCVIRTVERRRHARPGVDAWLDSRPYKHDYAEKPGPSENRPSRRRVSLTRHAHPTRPPQTRLLPRVEGPAVILKGTVRGLSRPVRLSLDSKGMLAHWSGIRLKAPARKRARAPRPPNILPTTVKERERTARKTRGKRAVHVKRKLAGDAGAEASGSRRATTRTQPESPGRRWRARGSATKRKAASASDTVANGDHRTSEDDFALELHGRQLLWAQHIAAISAPESFESSENNDDAEPEPSPEDNEDITTVEPPDGVGESTAKTSTVEKDGHYVRLTVDWRARTRVRSSLQPPKVHSVRIEVLPGELCAQFISRMVQLPPGAAYRDTHLSWGTFTIPPLKEMHLLRLGSWVFDTRAANPPEAVLSVPVGTVLTHPALVEAAGPNYLAMLSKDYSAGIVAAPESEHADVKLRLPDPNDDGFLAEWAGDVFTSEPMVKGRVDGLSNRALHPGRTDPECMAKILRKRGVVNEDETCTIVDVGSGDGNFVMGLQRAFPRACLCGIECQTDLFEESVRLCGRDANFMLGTAEKMLHRCHTANVIISTTHNFDASTVMSMVRTAARLPMTKYLVLGEPRLCTPRCKAVYGPCCCFEPIATEDVTTLWGNRSLPFVIYRRVVPWLLEANSALRITDEAIIAALRSGELNPYARAQSTFTDSEGTGTRPSAANKTEAEPVRREKRQKTAAEEVAPKLGLIDQIMKFAGVLPWGKEAAKGWK